MKKGLDVSKVDAALKRAARTAVSGDKAARSGRVMSGKLSGGELASSKSNSKNDGSRKSR